ncbi:alpha/beta hydrolase [Gloeocapsopsis crepidinum LEGE 06123]|uniref:Alpha/beta hydrolase n=1 Tax=Gloeocapsopsis crepidinum LEGE 06123 TaxID=588587 RepID=A0ABR9US93_9CHRO|nr:alpha/beta hydrolase [Gloeocapsopsis crepidinum]MBE9191129.1 alpha/beta hydrolase [Gloeocapsopsis crepidinum LEGE 06123]
MNQPTEHPQLIIKRYNQNGTTFAHCLICSTVPNNAESQYREDLFSDYSYSLNALAQLKETLKKFIESKWENSGQNILEKISIILDIHGYNVPLENFEKNTYEPLERKFQADTSGKYFDDFVIFINFSWPSESVLKSQWIDWLRAMPLMLQLLLIGAVALIFVFRATLLYSLGLILGGLVLCLVALRLVVYFRDRDRAANHGVFDAVELVRWLHVILQEILQEKALHSPEAAEHLKSDPEFFGVVNLSFVAHSMGCFVTTQMIRILSDIFDPSAIMRWKTTDGPFGGTDTKRSLTAEEIVELSKIGHFFTLKSLILASPDIPIWAITTGHSNFLKSCLPRFKEAYLFTNDADMVLRLASTVANYFVFPSASRIGGYRLGNLTLTKNRSYGMINVSDKDLGVRAFTRNINLTEKPFYSTSDVYQFFTVVDCTDYQDKLVTNSGLQGRRLSVLTANNSITNLLNYTATSICHFLGIGQIDSHGGYFRGKFCLDLIYLVALSGKAKLPPNLNMELKKHQIAWIETCNNQTTHIAKT